ncbi:MAG: cyclic pyranopterin monophosphate synthase MoaC [Candidatus Eremiobacter antarcticus]|nr:cyclic pyranopterin monophosphate synthase MoaC [Candidatus Eremiobacteraeota bacterium]MBC5807430.1 cyclic pyranopterin monophosphate synthase MoaC [Candidatus Eremiobacteraeota bacterium]PZR63204.1 MAG: cyclic pyranopterin monophosphate synthase MoaC [Candidatus Eremiobacter sp. RRmetagenome_bin22]
MVDHRGRRLSHVAPDGSVRMVDVGGKPVTQRRALAQAIVRLKPQALKAIRQRAAKKGDVLLTAQIAGIAAAKITSQLIPLSHPLPLTHVDVRCQPRGTDTIHIECAASCSGRTGVEMEAMTGAAVAALTVYDMCKALDREIVIEKLQLMEKSGGKSGRFRRAEKATLPGDKKRP